MAAPGPVPALPDTERRTSYAPGAASVGPYAVGFQLYGDGADYGAWLDVQVNGASLTAGSDWVLTSPSGSLATLPRPIQDAVITFTVAQPVSLSPGTIEFIGQRRPRRLSQVSENRGVSARDFNVIVTEIEATLREIFDQVQANGTVVVPIGTLALASRAEAEAGTDATKLITALRTAQAIAVRIPIPCTAAYAIVGGIGQFTLAAAAGATVPATLAVGQQVRFRATAVADTGLIQAKLTGVASPAGMLTIVSGNDRDWSLFHDIQTGDILTLEYTAGGNLAIVSCQLSRAQSMFPHGSVNIAAGGFKGLTGNTKVNFGAFDGGNIVVQDFTSGGFDPKHFATSGLSTDILDGTSYLNGVLSALALNSFYFVYCFNKSSNPRDIVLDFSQVVPGQSHSGHRVKSTDASRTFLGMIYTGATGDIGFWGTGTNLQVLVHSVFNSTLLPVTTVGIAVAGIASATFADLAGAKIDITVDAISKLPTFICHCGYTSDTSGAVAEMRIKVTGIAVAADGTQTTFTNYSDVMEVACPAANKPTQFSALYGQALDTGLLSATVQTRVLAGTATFKPTFSAPTAHQ